MPQRFNVSTSARSQVIDITVQVLRCVGELQLSDGAVCVFIPHTTAAVTINENADPDVPRDFLRQLDEMVPWQQPFFRHGEGNSAAHVKASMMGSSVMVIVESGQLRLGTWQGIWFCEFDGPRTREVWVARLT